MGKRGGARKASNVAFGSNNTISLREEAAGKKQGKVGSSNAKHISKVEHSERLAVWASSEASIPSLGAFFGRRLASVREALAVPPNPSMFSCQRSKKPNTSTQNNVVCTCHFCSYRNTKKMYVSSVKINRSKGEENLPVVFEETSTTDPSTHIVRSGLVLLGSVMRKRNRSTAMGGEKLARASRKRRRKSWTSLKEIAERSELDNNRSTSNMTIPFFL
ncbi:hypothetical protein UlMin_025873 [Ulmus minor]